MRRVPTMHWTEVPRAPRSAFLFRDDPEYMYRIAFGRYISWSYQDLMGVSLDDN